MQIRKSLSVVKGKGKVFPLQSRLWPRGWAIEGGAWSAARPGRSLPSGKTRYWLYRRLGGPQGRSGRAENLAPPGFDPQPVVSRCTDWATRSTPYQWYIPWPITKLAFQCMSPRHKGWLRNSFCSVLLTRVFTVIDSLRLGAYYRMLARLHSLLDLIFIRVVI